MTNGPLGTEAGARAGFKKKARKQRRTLVFIDESGLSTRPTRRAPGLARTNARAARVLQLEKPFHRGGLTLWRFYFQIHPGSIKSPSVM